MGLDIWADMSHYTILYITVRYSTSNIAPHFIALHDIPSNYIT